MKPGDEILITDREHAWFGKRGLLESYGAYGLPCLNLKGWLINIGVGQRTYAKSEQITKSKVQSADTMRALFQTIRCKLECRFQVSDYLADGGDRDDGRHVRLV